ncbi:hypothetical protein C4D60_Mb10t11730 [Musa balbisiana]|uniref:Uncharacterized protein n=1 Tax=Musa balbisiana TaxID=52838 RepID=A0A4V4H4S4_MUSBA|nr:hypothetical protein C4D60_Mb10t11730 [Musa balbisiana]
MYADIMVLPITFYPLPSVPKARLSTIVSYNEIVVMFRPLGCRNKLALNSVLVDAFSQLLRFLILLLPLHNLISFPQNKLLTGAAQELRADHTIFHRIQLPGLLKVIVYLITTKRHLTWRSSDGLATGSRTAAAC